MPKKRNALFFVCDMLISIDRIKRHTKNLKDAYQIAENELLSGAILRDLEIIGESMNHVLKAEHIEAKPYWRDIVDFRNIAIHEYFGLSYREIFSIIKHDIPTLEQELLEILHDVKDKASVKTVLEDLKAEMENLHRRDSVTYITGILSKFLN